MSQNKTQETQFSVVDYIKKSKPNSRQHNLDLLVNILTDHTKFTPKIWGTCIIGFGTYHYIYESGREGDAPLIGVSSRSNGIVIYLSQEFVDRDVLLKKLGPHTVSVACLYIKNLADIDVTVFKTIVSNSVKHLKTLYN